MLDIFYKEIIVEASTGSIDCLSSFNVIFETKIDELNINITNKSNYNNLIIPTLNITNVTLFNKLLTEYCVLASDFYKDNTFYEDLTNNSKFLYYKTKMILTLLWANATLENFEEPINYLQKRIAFLKAQYGTTSKNIGYSNLLKGELTYTISKSNIISESPWTFDLQINNEGSIYHFPSIYFGTEKNNLTIYAIQNKDKNKDLTNQFYKYINRKLYKVNSGTESLDITHNFLYVFNALIQIVSTVDNIIVPNFLVSRWNSKEIACNKKNEYYKDSGKEYNLDEEINKHNIIQYNLTNKLMNVLIMFEDLYDNVDFSILSDSPNIDNKLSIMHPLETDNKILSDFNALVSSSKKFRI